MPTPALALVIRWLGPEYDPERRIRVLRASQDPELLAYFRFLNAAGSTDMDADGRICVKIDDTRSDIKGLCLEELWHAMQYLRDGNVPLDTDNTVRSARELEAAQCLLKHAGRFRLSPSELEHCTAAVREYGGAA